MLEKAPPWLNARQDIAEEQMEGVRRALLRHLAVFKASLHEAEALAVPGPTPSSGAGPALCGQKAWLDTGAPAAVAAVPRDAPATHGVALTGLPFWEADGAELSAGLRRRVVRLSSVCD